VALTPLASQKRPLLLPGGRFLFGVPARILEALAQPKSFEPNAASGFAPGHPTNRRIGARARFKKSRLARKAELLHLGTSAATKGLR
jgi:hypothetical protein